MDSIYADLQVSETQASGIIEDIPAGERRKFEIFTFDNEEKPTFYGKEYADVPAGETISLHIVLFPIDSTGTVIISGDFSDYPERNAFINCLYLDGKDDYVSIPEIVVKTREFTIEAWVRAKGLGGGYASQNPLFQQRNDVSGQIDIPSIVFFIEATYPYMQTGLDIRSSYGSRQFVNVLRKEYDTWYHYASTVNSERINLFINGILVQTMLNEQQGIYNQMIDYIDIGRHRHDGIDRGFLFGEIDEFRVWNKARSQTQIQSVMNDTLDSQYYSTPDSGLVAYWRFDCVEDLGVGGDGADDLRDLSTNTIHADIVGDPQIVPHYSR